MRADVATAVAMTAVAMTAVAENGSEVCQAEDIVHDVLVRVYERRGELQNPGKLRAWLYQITRNALIDHYRAHDRVRFEAVTEDLPQPSEDLDWRTDADLAKCLRPFLDALPDRYREALVLAEVEGLPQKEVGDRLGLSLSGAKSRIQRGRKMMADSLLGCCDFELDQRGWVMDFDRRKDCACGC